MIDRDGFVMWLRMFCADEAIYSRQHGNFDRATAYNAMSMTYDGTHGSAWYDFNIYCREVSNHE